VVFGNPLDFFTNYGHYMPRLHCMVNADGRPDYPWIIALTGTTSLVIIGYLRIVMFWRRAYLKEEKRDRNRKLMQLAYIFLVCALCGYVMSLLSFVWPAYRLLAIFTGILAFVTWQFILTLGDFGISFSARRFERLLNEKVAAQTTELRDKVFAATSDLRAINEELEVARRESQKLALVASYTGNAVIITDKDGRIEWVNDSFVRISGYSLNEVLGKKPGTFLQGANTDPAEVDRIRTSVRDGVSVIAELINYHKSGAPYWIRLEVQPVKDSAGQVTQFIAIETDITQSKQQSAELARARDAAEAANRAKSEFLANMSHEIRTPLSGIIGFSQMLVEEPTADLAFRTEWAQTIQSSAKHLLTLINDVLDHSKIEAGKFGIERIPCSPQALLGEIVSIMRVPAVEKGLELQLNYLTPLPHSAMIDPTRFKQVLLNLVNNAIKFTSQGNVRIFVSCTGEKTDAKICIQVADTGIGMAREQLSRIFKPFVQADSTTTRRFGGTGLGLSISRHICELLGGTLVVDSVENIGSTFTATIGIGDISQAAFATGDTTEASQPNVARSVPSGVLLKGLDILVVDDGTVNRKLFGLILTRAGASVTMATNGSEALAAVADHPPFSAILMDMQMPVMDGYSAASELRRRGISTPVIALTAHAMQEERARCINAGCCDYLTKPVDTDLLLNTLVKWTRTNAPAAAPQMPRTPQTHEPIRSRLPIDDPEFAAIADEFVACAAEKVNQFRDAVTARNWSELKELSHWLKGAGGSAGYPLLSDAARQLESEAAREAVEEVSATLGTLCELVDRCRAGTTDAALAGSPGGKQ
jgi:PAS domain S-box-containing protein